jgi:hypothetical protein
MIEFTVEVVPVHQWIKHHGIKTYMAPSFEISALDGDEWLAWLPCRFTPREIAPVPIV